MADGDEAAQQAAAAGATAFTIEDPRIKESSGLAASRTHPGVYWTHNDSDDGPYIYAVDSRTGRTVATVTLAGITPRDVEAISLGPDGSLYVGDIGDNFGGRWKEVWIYRFAEPKTLKDTTVTPTRYTVRYEDGPRDAESLMVHPKTGRVYVVSKKRSGKGALYAAPEKLSASGVNVFRRTADIGTWATDGAFSPDGTRLVVRGYFDAIEYRWRDGRPEEIGRPSVPLQRQGESVTFTADGRTLMYGTEGKRSSVQPVALEGDLLPDTVAPKPRDGDDGKGAAGASRDSGDGDGGSSNRTLAIGAGTLVVAAVSVVGVRRLFRRSRR
ncbi:esterase-like activity of phytase family protein [Streptomyces rectiverticillatus]|nr:esterase-like activity of phytase family protein [Streptomyces rectiverticillatus]